MTLVNPVPISQRQKRRSSYGLSLSPGSVPLVGSYEQSLLSGRMLSSRKAALPFLATLGVTPASNPASKAKLPPPHLSLAFDAFFSGEDVGNSPYVGHIDLEQHFYNLLANSESRPLPHFPGYRIPQKGTVQLVIKNANRTAVKVFLVPYDLSDMPLQSKTFLQQKSYISFSQSVGPSSPINIGPSPTPKGNLKYAVHLQFCCIPSQSSKSFSPSRPKYYLHKVIKVVFAFRTPDASEQLHLVTEGPEGYSSSKVRMQKYSTYEGPDLDWAAARKSRRDRDRLQKALEDLKLDRNGPIHYSEDALDTEEESSALGNASFSSYPETPRSIASFDPDACEFGFSSPTPLRGRDPILGVEEDRPTTLVFQRQASFRQATSPPIESGLSTSRPGSRLQSHARETPLTSASSPKLGSLPLR